MQSNLNIKENPNQTQQINYNDNKTFNAFSFSIFQLLQEIITFKYNLNSHEFETSYETKARISFPDSVISAILKKDFLDSLYLLINRLLEANAEKYFSVCLECLEKILAAKVVYV